MAIGIITRRRPASMTQRYGLQAETVSFTNVTNDWVTIGHSSKDEITVVVDAANAPETVDTMAVELTHSPFKLMQTGNGNIFVANVGNSGKLAITPNHVVDGSMVAAVPMNKNLVYIFEHTMRHIQLAGAARHIELSSGQDDNTPTLFFTRVSRPTTMYCMALLKPKWIIPHRGRENVKPVAVVFVIGQSSDMVLSGSIVACRRVAYQIAYQASMPDSRTIIGIGVLMDVACPLITVRRFEVHKATTRRKQWAQKPQTDTSDEDTDDDDDQYADARSQPASDGSTDE